MRGVWRRGDQGRDHPAARCLVETHRRADMLKVNYDVTNHRRGATTYSLLTALLENEKSLQSTWLDGDGIHCTTDMYVV